MSFTIRLKILPFLGRVLGIQFKVSGLPYGAEYKATSTNFERNHSTTDYTQS